MKKIVSIFLSLVMLLTITSGLNLTAYADDVNHYLDFQAEIYSSETAGFDNIFVGTDSSSFSRTFYNELKNDTKFQVSLAAWSSTHIVDDATYTIENNVFKKKDLYDAILFDMIDSTDESTLCQQYQNEFEKLYKMVKNERSSYVIKTTDMILGKEKYTVEQLKTTDLSEDAKDLLLNGTKYAGVTSVISEVNKILGNVKNAYDAINAVADYLAIKDVDCGTSEILNEIASDSQSPIELRYSAAEISDCMAGAYGKTAALIAEGSISGIEFALNKAINYAWDSVLACIPGGTAISFGAKTGRMLVNYFFKTETVIQGYYQLEAAVNIEDAIVRVMQNKKNADTGYTNIDSAVYMKSVDMYKDIILLGFDYSIELLQNAANSDFNTATDFWLGNYSQCMQLIDQIQELKQKKIDNFVKYEEIVFNKYKSLYLPNYDELEDEISKTVPVTALSVTQLVDINIGDSAYFEDCFAYNFEPYNYTESVTNVSVTSSDSNIISVVKGDDSKEKFVANNAGTCTLTFTLNDRITCQKEVIVGSITSGKCGENVTYSLDTSTGVLTISGTGDMADYSSDNSSPFYNNSNVKSVIIENGVTSIGNRAFYCCRSLTSVKISNSVTSIGDYALGLCDNLKKITIPYNVTSIGDAAFTCCTSLTSITIPDSVINMGDYAFDDCESLASIIIGNGVESIGNYAFRNCHYLTSIIIGNGVESIGNYAFQWCIYLESIIIPDSVIIVGDSAFGQCESLTNITIGNSVTSIGHSAFEYCTNLSSVTIGNSVTSIDNYAFYDCTSLTDIIIPDSVISIGKSAFEGCTRLTSVIISNSLISIGDYAFNGCKRLTSVTIPNSVTSIGYSTFENCKSLASIEVLKNNNDYASVDGVLFNKNKTNLIEYPAGKTDTTYKIPDSVTNIGGRAFVSCAKLQSVVIPNSVTSIGSGAFANCTGLTSVTVPDSVISIGDSAFYDCTSLISITIPNSVISIGEYAFDGCRSLTSAKIPDSITSIGAYTFWYCINLTSVTIPSSVTSIGYGAFYYCPLKDVYYTGTEEDWNKVKKDSIPNATIHYNFEPCTENQHNYYGEWKIIEEPTCTKAGSKQRICAYDGYVQTATISPLGHDFSNNAQFCLNGCGEVNPNYVVPDPSIVQTGSCGENVTYSLNTSTGVLTISGTGKMKDYSGEDSPFYQNSNIKSVIIENGVTNICDFAFQDCTNLVSVTIGNTVISIGDLAFYGCTSLASVAISDSVTSIGLGAFNDCTSLTSVKIPDSVTIIGDIAFYNCASLTSIEVSDNNKNYSSVDGVLFNKDKTELIIYPAGKPNDTYEIPKSVTSICVVAFAFCSSLTSITILASVTSIGNDAFYGCKNLSDIYYIGTQEEWNKIYIGSTGNGCLPSVTIHYSSIPIPEPKPTPTPEPTPTPNPTPQPSTQPTQETTQQAAQQTVQQQSVINDTATEQVSVAKPKSVKPKTVKAAKKAVSVEWKKVSGVSGYEIQVAIDKKFKKNKKTVTVKKQKTTKTTVKKLKAKKKYYVRIRTYKTVNGKKVYSSWSKVKSVKTK